MQYNNDFFVRFKLIYWWVFCPNICISINEFSSKCKKISMHILTHNDIA